MKVIAFIEARQGEILEKILRHCGLWHDPHRRGPPASAEVPEPDQRRTIEPDPEFLELARREEQAEQLNLAFD